MYVHLGGDLVVTTDEIVAVLDAKGLVGSEINAELTAHARNGGRVYGDIENAGSLVVTTRGVYASALSAATVARRILWRRETPGRTRGLSV